MMKLATAVPLRLLASLSIALGSAEPRLPLFRGRGRAIDCLRPRRKCLSRSAIPAAYLESRFRDARGRLPNAVN